MEAGSFDCYEAHYNSLPDDVDQQFGRLMFRSNYMGAIEEALHLIHKYDAADFLGVFLLHRHFEATADTIFVERAFVPDAIDHDLVLVTAPMAKNRIADEIAPHRFRIDAKGKLVALEYSSDPLVHRNWARLRGARRLLSALGAKLAELKFGDLLGLGIYRREAEAGRPTSVYLEDTDFEKQESVVHALPALPRVSGRLVPTLWTAGDAGNGCCSQSCVAYCSHPAKGKLGLGYCGHKKQGHVGCA